MPVFKKVLYIGYFLLIVIISLPPNLSGQTVNLVPQQSTGANNYPEIESYRQTLSPEITEAYNVALAEYLTTEPSIRVITSNAKLSERYNTVTGLPEMDAGQISDKILELQALSEAAARKNETYLELDCLYRAYMLAFWSEHRQYARGFELAMLLEERLPQVTEQQYPDLREVWFRISEGYYLFLDFDKSIELGLNAVTNQPPLRFTDRSNLEARRIVGICYSNIGEMDLSDTYFMSIIESGDIVLDRPTLNAMALANLGCNAMMRGEYRKAISLDTEVLELLKHADDPGHVAGMYACQCASYFGLGEPDMAGMLTDSILYYARQDNYNRNKRLKQAYANLSRYNGYVGNIPGMQQWQDSLVAVYKREEAIASSQYILQAQQEIARNRIQTREETLRHQRFLTRTVLAVLAITVFFLIIILRMYRRQQSSYKALAEKARAWADSGAAFIGIDPYAVSSTGSKDGVSEFTEIAKNGEELTALTGTAQETISDEETRELSDKLKAYMEQHKPYTDPELSLESLAKQMGVTRNNLSRAINSTSNKSFKIYINDLRIMEALRLMTATAPDRLSMEQLMEQAGFNGRTTFYTTFKSITGLTPAQYWKSIDFGKEN